MTQNRWPLPLEITERILDLLCGEQRNRWFRIKYKNLRGTAQYASVCKEWQELVERRTFCNLRLTRARLADVDRIVCRRRQTYVCTVDLNVELEPYGAEVYGDFETAEETARNSVIFSETVRLFFDIFSRWTPGSDLYKERGGISLRITAFSPSDVGHCGMAEKTRRERAWTSPELYGDRYIHSILQMLPAATVLPVVKCVSELISGKERHISAHAWTLIVNGLPNTKKIDIDFWENEKKDLELRKRLRDEIGNALAQMRCPNAYIKLSCGYMTPKDHSSIPPTLSDRGVDNTFTRGLRIWARQLKQLELSDVVIAPEMFYAADSDQEAVWPYLERLEINYAAVTPYGTWLLEHNPDDSPLDRPSPVVEEGRGQDGLCMEMPAPEDMYEYDFRTLAVAAEVDQIHRSAARAARLMPALQYLYLGTYDVAIQFGHRYHGFLYRYDAATNVATAHWGNVPGYTPPEDVVELWRKAVEEVRGCKLEVLIDENGV